VEGRSTSTSTLDSRLAGVDGGLAPGVARLLAREAHGLGVAVARDGAGATRHEAVQVVPPVHQHAAPRARLRTLSIDDKFGASIVTLRVSGGRFRVSSRGSLATPADSPHHDGSPCSHVHVRRERFA
jgi:hypothetical protein